MDRYLDGSYFEPNSGFGGGGAFILALGALAILFFTRDGRDLVRMYIYIFGGIFTVAPLIFNPSMFSIWWPLVVAIAFFSDRWEDNREKERFEKRTRQSSSLSNNSEEISFSDTHFVPGSKSQAHARDVNSERLRSTPHKTAHYIAPEGTKTNVEGSANRNTESSSNSITRKQKAANDIVAKEKDQKRRLESRTEFRPKTNTRHGQISNNAVAVSNARVRIWCPQCSAAYEVPEPAMRDHTSVQCSACKFVWTPSIQRANDSILEGSFYSASKIVTCSRCYQAHSISPKERTTTCSRCGAQLDGKNLQS